MSLQAGAQKLVKLEGIVSRKDVCMATMQAASNKKTATLKSVSGKLYYQLNISYRLAE